MTDGNRNIFGKLKLAPRAKVKGPREKVGEFSVTLDGEECELFIPAEGVTGGDVLHLWKQARDEARRQRELFQQNREDTTP